MTTNRAGWCENLIFTPDILSQLTHLFCLQNKIGGSKKKCENASRLNSMILRLLTEHHLDILKFKRRLHRLIVVYTCQNTTLLEITCHRSIIWQNFNCMLGKFSQFFNGPVLGPNSLQRLSPDDTRRWQSKLSFTSNVRQQLFLAVTGIP